MVNNFLTSLLGLNLYVYGLGVALTLIAFLFLYWRQLRKTSLNEEKMLDAMFAAALTALIFGRVAYFFLNPALFNNSFSKLFLILNYPGVSEFYFWLAFFFYWWLYGTRKKIALANLSKLFLMPVVVSRLFLGFISLLKEADLAALLMPLLLLGSIGIYFLLTRTLKKEELKNYPLLALILYLSIPNFIVDFFKEDRVYCLLPLRISWQQLPYLAVTVAAFAYFALLAIKKRRKK